MKRILDIALKDLLQLQRDPKTYLFLLFMPLAFTVLFGFAFGAFNRGMGDPRLPVGFLDKDRSSTSRHLRDLLNESEVILLEKHSFLNESELEALVADEKLAAAVIVPQGYGRGLMRGKTEKLFLIGDTGTTSGISIESDVIAIAMRLESVVRTATILDDLLGEKAPYDYVFEEALTKWEDPPISVTETTSSAIESEDEGNDILAHQSPGMMLQFAIAGLLTAAQILVSERKSRSLARLLTTATTRVQVLLGHYLAIYFLIFTQFVMLILFGQFVLNVNYLRDPIATLLVASSAVLCIAALGLLIGILARSEEQAVMFSLLPMFVFSGIGGAWVPLEFTGKTFQAIGHISPVAWAMDGFKNITLRGLGFEGVWIPCLALVGYAVLFFGLAVWRFRRQE